MGERHPDRVWRRRSPAARLLDRALEAAGVDREHLYVTNAVKHFKWQLRGKRGQFVEGRYAPYVFATFHPSALLRLKDESEKEAAFEQLVKDLKLIKKALGRP